MAIDTKAFARVELLAANISAVMFTAMEFAFESMGSSGKVAAEPSREEIVRKVSKIHAESKPDKDRKKIMTKVMTDDDVERLCALPERYLPGRPSLAGKLSFEQLADYVALGTKQDPGFRGLIAEFMEAGEAFQRRAAIGAMPNVQPASSGSARPRPTAAAKKVGRKSKPAKKRVVSTSKTAGRASVATPVPANRKQARTVKKAGKKKAAVRTAKRRGAPAKKRSSR